MKKNLARLLRIVLELSIFPLDPVVFQRTTFIGDYFTLQILNLPKEEFVQTLRRQSTGFSRGSSKYRGVTLHKCGRWEARMGQLLGKKYDVTAVITN